MGWAACDDRAAARQRRSEIPFDFRDDFPGFGHAAHAALAAGHRSFLRSGEHDAAGLQERDVGAGCRVLPHADVHRRRGDHVLVGGKEHGRREVVGDAARHFCERVRRRRRHDQDVGFARQPDMAHFGFVGEGKEIAIDLFLAEGGHRQRGDEPGCGFREHAAYGGAAFAQAAYQLETPVRGDAAGDDQENAFAAQHPSAPERFAAAHARRSSRESRETATRRPRSVFHARPSRRVPAGPSGGGAVRRAGSFGRRRHGDASAFPSRAGVIPPQFVPPRRASGAGRAARERPPRRAAGIPADGPVPETPPPAAPRSWPCLR